MDPILGQIILWPLNWVPDGWMACEGQELSIQTNTALYSLLGVTYGGNGTSTFKLPDLRSRVPLGAQMPTQVGTVSGAPTSSMVATGTGTITLQPSQVPLPSHTHSATFTSTTGSSTTVYRLHLTAGPVVEQIYPAGVSAVGKTGVDLVELAFWQASITRPQVIVFSGPQALKAPMVRSSARRTSHAPRSRPSMIWIGSLALPGTATSPPLSKRTGQ